MSAPRPWQPHKPIFLPATHHHQPIKSVQPHLPQKHRIHVLVCALALPRRATSKRNKRQRTWSCSRRQFCLAASGRSQAQLHPLRHLLFPLSLRDILHKKIIKLLELSCCCYDVVVIWHTHMLHTLPRRAVMRTRVIIWWININCVPTVCAWKCELKDLI